MNDRADYMTELLTVLLVFGGEDGIRTHGLLAQPPDPKSSPIDRSGTSPRAKLVPPVGIEPTTAPFREGRSIRLSYGGTNCTETGMFEHPGLAFMAPSWVPRKRRRKPSLTQDRPVSQGHKPRSAAVLRTGRWFASSET